MSARILASCVSVFIFLFCSNVSAITLHELRNKPVLEMTEEERQAYWEDAKKRMANSEELYNAVIYSRENPVIAVAVNRGDFDLDKLPNSEIERIINGVLGKSFNILPEKYGIPTKYWFVSGANDSLTTVTYFIAGLDIHYDLNGDGKKNIGETSYPLGQSVSKGVIDEVVTGFEALYLTTFGEELLVKMGATGRLESLGK